jgi:tRNA uracil 4-sulfurtransferase
VWLMLKRGCSVTAVHLSNSPAQTERVRALVDLLNRYAYGRPVKLIVLSHADLVEPVLDRLRSLRAGRWACLFCKRAMLERAAAVADESGASALVTGDSLGQVASQTLSNLEAISYGIAKPILRPLIGLDKTEIMALARQIGTYDASTQEAYACPFLPARPLTQSSLPKLQALLEALEATASAPDLAGRRSMTEPSPDPEEGEVDA